MMNQMQKNICALAVLAATSLPAMADSVDVHVIGTITPAACTPTLSGGATIDYGNINPNTLSETNFTVLPAKQLDFAVTCNAPAKIALKAINGRIGSVAGATENANGTAVAPVDIFGLGATGVAGLGLDGTAKVGGYGLRIAAGSVTADGNTVDSIRENGTNIWTHDAYADIIFSPYSDVRNISWAKTGTTTPVAFTNLAGKLEVQAYLNKASELDLTKPVALDGLTTIELVYL